jgi:hypothetical protein
MLSPLSVPETGIVPMLCPFFLHNEIFLSSPALATTKSAKTEPTNSDQSLLPKNCSAKP